MTAKTTLFVDFFSTFLMISVLFSSDAFLIASLTMFLLYCLDISISSSSLNLLVRSSVSLQMRTSRNANEYGTLLKVCVG